MNSSSLILLYTLIGLIGAINAPFMCIVLFYFLTGKLVRNDNISEYDSDSLEAVLLPTMIFYRILFFLEDFRETIQSILFFVFFGWLIWSLGGQIINMGNSLNWNWFDWLLFVPVALFCPLLISGFFSVYNDEMKAKKEEKEQPTGLFK